MTVVRVDAEAYHRIPSLLIQSKGRNRSSRLHKDDTYRSQKRGRLMTYDRFFTFSPHLASTEDVWSVDGATSARNILKIRWVVRNVLGPWRTGPETMASSRPQLRLNKIPNSNNFNGQMLFPVVFSEKLYKACCRCKISISGKEIARRIAVKITPSCCLSKKWRIINLLDDIWMRLPEVESLGSWRKAIRGFSSGRPRGTTPVDYRYIILQAIRNRRQTAGEIARHTTQATGRPISRFTVARRLHGGDLFARRPVRCAPLTPAHRRWRSLWCREHRNWRANEWGRVLFTDESRFSLCSDSHRILIWRERGSRNHPSNIIERDRYGGRSVLVWGGIMLGSRTDLHIFDAGSVNGTRYCNEILLPYVRLFRGAMGLQFLFMDDNVDSSCRTALRE
ncbi:transposable element Tc3 transposase [Trichonephila clavipes]|nr:transposable element Tc3 transposase [Trichonephila clavipes]